MTATETSSDIVIRRHQPGDRPRLVELLELSMLETYPDLKPFTRSVLRTRVEAEFAQYYALEEKEIWVAMVAGQVAGCLWVMESFHPVTEIPDLFVVNIAVYPQFQGRGLARRLFAEATSHAHKLGISRLRLFVNPVNQSAYSLYLKLGFEPQTHEMRLLLP